MKELKIIPIHEPHGEGNGWEECDEAVATYFEIDDGDEVVGGADTRAKAKAEVKRLTIT